MPSCWKWEVKVQGLSVGSDLVSTCWTVSVLSTPVLPLQHHTEGWALLCSLYFTGEHTGSWGAKAQGDLIIYHPNQDTIECETGCYDWLLQDNGGKRGLSPASQDVWSSYLSNFPEFPQLISGRAASWATGFLTPTVFLPIWYWNILSTLANSQQGHKRACHCPTAVSWACVHCPGAWALATSSCLPACWCTAPSFLLWLPCHDQLTEDMEASFLCGGCGESQRGSLVPGMELFLVCWFEKMIQSTSKNLDPGESREEWAESDNGDWLEPWRAHTGADEHTGGHSAQRVWWQEGALSKGCWLGSEDEGSQRRKRPCRVLYVQVRENIAQVTNCS